MSPVSRRTFLKTSALAAGAGIASRLTRSVWADPVGAGDAVRIGVIGLHNKGGDHLKQLQELPGARVVALCDVDPQILSHAIEGLKDRQIAPFATTQARELLARSDVDAVVIATPNHWHALLTLWACQAGKDVYVEKPMSHTVWEGRKMIEAAKRYGRIVQVGTQYRSDPGLQAAGRYLREGNLGKMLHVHAVYFNLRKDIGYKLPWYPDWLSYDTYCGPAPMAPLERASLHYDWHWSWATGNGDLGNNGVHMLDMGLFFTGHQTPPRRVICVGGRYVVADRAETPNSMLTVYDYPEVPFIFEHRGLPAKPGVNYMDQTYGIRVGIVVQCEGGYFAGANGGAVYDSDRKLVKKFPGDGGAGHMPNFLAAVRSRRVGDLAAPVDVAHTGASLCHFGNISYRIGETADLDHVRDSLQTVPAAGQYLEGLAGNLGANGVDIARNPLRLGKWIQVEGDEIAQVESGSEEALQRARFLLRETHRPPYLIPDQV
ncbi:MAG TPA: Gfo/Idh/MocA family oxidoreductase [Opitutaceae bacterium]|nr:Gfo/Idh/MocA family oxidoreductase [Opitutaceae bacterium]